jgi:ABC-type uncharacterized transport system permease subunit
MGLNTIWQQCVYGIHQMWLWLSYEISVHPLLFLGVVIVILSAWVLYKTEVRTK